MATRQEIEAAKERHLRVTTGESLTKIYERPDGVFAEFEHLLIAEGMHAGDCQILADAFCGRQSHPVNEWLATLLKAVSIQDFGMFADDVDGKNWFYLRDEAIAAVKAETAEREKPVTREWLRSIGSVRVPDDLYPHSEGNDNEEIGALRLWGFDETGTWYMQGADWFDLKTRGQVLDLVRVMGAQSENNQRTLL